MLARLFAVTLILFCLELGLFLLLAPWTALWQYNYFLIRWPEMTPWLTNYYLRGAVSGLGLVDIGLGLSYLVRFRRLSASFGKILYDQPPETAQANEPLDRDKPNQS